MYDVIFLLNKIILFEKFMGVYGLEFECDIRIILYICDFFWV